MNDLDEESEEEREEIHGDVYNNIADKIGVYDDGEKEEIEQIKMYEKDDNSPHKNKQDVDEDENEDEIYCVSIALIFIIFLASYRK